MQGYSFDLSGRTALVTGASSGIGLHFARALARSGARVVLVARRIERLEELRSAIEAEGGRAFSVAMDVSDEASIVAGFNAAEEAFGPIDTVVANAGLARPGSALDLSVDDFDATMATNQRGVFLTAREGARRMIENGAPTRGHGRIVLISSITAFHVTRYMSAYSASKAAVLQMGRVLAKEWATQGVNVNVIAPGYMATEMTEEVWQQEAGKQLLSSFPRKRIMSVDALSPLLLYLCSDASLEVTGSVFSIEDGQTL
ncbi:SDR family NAD(P)-dependent oxidoreductase [Novosphingobium sp.]|uniref:SDR family NAD(P)-dependent oxidoreductase n=2 Tax=Novosphingobium sp. TaxID=1874826 RepID=UPI002FDA7B33